MGEQTVSRDSNGPTRDDPSCSDAVRKAAACNPRHLARRNDSILRPSLPTPRFAASAKRSHGLASFLAGFRGPCRASSDRAGVPARKSNKIVKVASGRGTHDDGMHGIVGIDRVALQNYAMPVRAGELERLIVAG